jgi:hypothetical protein
MGEKEEREREMEQVGYEIGESDMSTYRRESVGTVMYSTMFADELYDNVAITVYGNCSTHPGIENGTMQVHATESDSHMVKGKSVGNEKQRARQLLGGRLLHQYQRQS